MSSITAKLLCVLFALARENSARMNDELVITQAAGVHISSFQLVVNSSAQLWRQNNTTAHRGLRKRRKINSSRSGIYKRCICDPRQILGNSRS